MLTPVVQRWRNGRASYRPAGETIRVQDFDVGEIDGKGSDTLAKRFVTDHHYDHNFPSASLRFGFYERGLLVGVAVFGTPCRSAVLAGYPGEKGEKYELSRFVLLDNVKANGETRFLGLVFKELRKKGILSVVSFADPVARFTSSGRRVMPGHVGTIYQGHNAHYFGRSRAETKFLLPDGTMLHRRAIAKVIKRHKGWKPTVARLERFGATPPRGSSERQMRRWIDEWVPALTRSVWHTGNHRYAWILNDRVASMVETAIWGRGARKYPKVNAAALVRPG